MAPYNNQIIIRTMGNLIIWMLYGQWNYSASNLRVCVNLAFAEKRTTGMNISIVGVLFEQRFVDYEVVVGRIRDPKDGPQYRPRKEVATIH